MDTHTKSPPNSPQHPKRVVDSTFQSCFFIQKNWRVTWQSYAILKWKLQKSRALIGPFSPTAVTSTSVTSHLNLSCAWVVASCCVMQALYFLLLHHTWRVSYNFLFFQFLRSGNSLHFLFLLFSFTPCTPLKNFGCDLIGRWFVLLSCLDVECVNVVYWWVFLFLGHRDAHPLFSTCFGFFRLFSKF